MLSAAKFIHCAILLTLALPSLGCVGTPRVHQEVALTSLVKKAYQGEPNVPKSSKYARHFERGWKQAYYDVSRGGEGHPPSVPPEMYWSIKYQNAEGSRMISSWFGGYECGALAAQRDGRSLYSTVPLGSVRQRGEGACEPVPAIRYPTDTETVTELATDAPRQSVTPVNWPDAGTTQAEHARYMQRLPQN